MSIPAYTAVVSARARTIDCPICGREVGVAPHEPTTPLSAKQLWFIGKLRNLGVPKKAVAKMLGMPVSSLGRAIFRMDHGR